MRGRCRPCRDPLSLFGCAAVGVKGLNISSDVDARPGKEVRSASHCWLIRGGDIYVLWDVPRAGRIERRAGECRNANVCDDLANDQGAADLLGNEPERVSLIG